MQQPWHREGLRFSCTRCGACCTGAPGYVWVNAEEIRQIAQHLDQPEEETKKQYVRQVGVALSLTEKTNGDCVFYDRQAKGCSIYPVRPRQCRTWPFWPSNLKTEEAWKATCEVCPGAGQGTVYSYEQVVENASVIRL